MSRLQHYLLSLPVMTGCATNKVLHFLPSLLLLLRHTDISLSKSVNMLLPLVPVAMETRLWSICLGVEPISQWKGLILCHYWGSLCIYQYLREIQQYLSLSRNWIGQDGACISELWYFCSHPHPIARISHWFCGLYTTSKWCHQYRSCTSLHQCQLNCQYPKAPYSNQWQT